jgi:phage-related protein
MPSIVQTILADHEKTMMAGSLPQSTTVSQPSIEFQWPEVDEPGLPNVIKSTMQSIIGMWTAFINFIQKYLNVQKIKDLAKDILDFPNKAIKVIIDTYLAEIKLPDLSKYVPSLQEIQIIPTVLLESLKKIVKLEDPLSAVKQAVSSVISTANSAASWISEWLESHLKMFVMMVGIAGSMVKIIVDFVTKSFNDLLKGFTSLVGVVKSKLQAIVDSLLKKLKMDVQIPGVPTIPIVSVISSIIKSVFKILEGLPGSVLSLSSFLPKVNPISVNVSVQTTPASIQT